jgi:hypothetical protein
LVTYVLLARVVALILYIDTETDLTRPSYPRNSYISVRHFEPTSESASVSLDRRFHDKGVLLVTWSWRGLTSPQAKTLQFLDLSQNSLDKRSIEYIANALPQAPGPCLSSLRLDDCFLKPQALEALGMSVSYVLVGVSVNRI